MIRPATDEIARQLRSDRPLQPAPENLPRKVVETLALQDDPPLSDPAGHRLFPVWRLAAISLAALLCLTIWKSNREPTPPQTALVAPAAVHSEAPVIEMPVLSLGSLPPWALNPDEPLEQEWRLLLADARNAVGFLLTSFLPAPEP